jgi:hypothetical protein
VLFSQSVASSRTPHSATATIASAQTTATPFAKAEERQHGIRTLSTEASIIVARKIKFIPPTLDGRLVSVFIQLEYNFNLY